MGKARKPLLIFPFGGNAKEALDAMGDEWECLGFLDDNPALHGDKHWGHPVLGREVIQQHSQSYVLAVPGNEKNYFRRLALIQGLSVHPDRWATVVHPHASVSVHAKIGKNVLVLAGAVVTASAQISDHVVMLPQSVVHHDAVVGEGSLLGAHAVVAGHVQVGRECFLGSGAIIRSHLKTGDRSLLGMGAVLTHDLPAREVWAGVPARKLSRQL